MTFKPYIYKEAPDVIQIETNIICNAKCDFCTQRKVTRKPSIMKMEVVQKIIDDTRGLGITYRPFLLNEPFTDERMVDICKYIKKDPTAKIEFNTNASLLTPALTDKLLDIGISLMRFSIDGFYEGKYNQRRKGLNFKDVVSNAEYFCKKANGTGTFTDVRMIAFPQSEDEQKLFVNKWSKLADKAETTSLYRYPWEGQEETIFKPCLKIRKEMFFYVDGRAALCCWDTNERAVIGDATKQKVLDIWNGEIVKKYREFLNDGQRDKISLCSRCDAYKDHKFE